LPVADAGGAADGKGGAGAGLGCHAGNGRLPGVAENGAVPALRIHVVEEDDLRAALGDGNGQAVAVLVPCDGTHAPHACTVGKETSKRMGPETGGVTISG
jgi:hypothetical protein